MLAFLITFAFKRYFRARIVKSSAEASDTELRFLFLIRLTIRFWHIKMFLGSCLVVTI